MPTHAPRDAPAVGDRFEVEIESVAAGGAGVGRLPNGRVVFAQRTAPGDRVRLDLTAVKGQWARGRLLEVLEPGPARRPPLCPHYARCGGCTLEHLEYEAQVEAKSQLVTDALVRIGGLTQLPRVETHPAPREVRYRNRVSFTLLRLRSRAGAPPRIVAGFHELERPGRILDVDGRCLLPEEPVARAWDGVRAEWAPGAARLPPGRELRLTLRGLVDGQVLLLVEGGATAHWPAENARHLLSRVGELQAVWHRPSGTDEARLVAGTARLEELWHGERYPVRPDAFLQVNREGAEHLHELALREVGAPRGRRVVDAYCGIGVYARRMARHGALAVGIEADPAAAAMARSRPVEGCTILEGRVEDRLEEALPADVVIVNPPRTGVAGGVMERLAGAAPERIVYVSCDPATLARDVARLGEGYRVRRIQIFDLFPQTAHVETLLTLDRA